MKNHSNSTPLTIPESYSMLSQSGFSFGPASTDKRPLVRTWKPLQEHPPSNAAPEFEFSYNNPLWQNAPAVFVITGSVSGNCEVIDFDEKYQRGITKKWRELLRANYPDISLKDFLITRTKSNGYHLYYRINPGDIDVLTPLEGNLKLAKSNIGETLIETRGQHGYVVAPPSPGYSIIQGSFESIPVISLELRDILLSTARALDQYHRTTPDGFPEPDPAKAARTLASLSKSKDGDRPGDSFEREASWHDILTAYGWHSPHPTARGATYVRPGKKHGVSGEVRAYGDHEVFIVYSSNASPLQSENYYTKFGAYALLKHGGDFKAATRELGAYLLRNPTVHHGR